MPDTPVGRVTEHVRVTVSPMRTGKDGEELITMNAGSKENEWIKTSGVLINQNVFLITYEYNGSSFHNIKLVGDGFFNVNGVCFSSCQPMELSCGICPINSLIVNGVCANLLVVDATINSIEPACFNTV